MTDGRYTLDELVEAGVLEEGSLETILVNKIKGVADQVGGEAAAYAAQFDTLAIEIDSLDTFKTINSFIELVGSRV